MIEYSENFLSACRDRWYKENCPGNANEICGASVAPYRETTIYYSIYGESKFIKRILI